MLILLYFVLKYANIFIFYFLKIFVPKRSNVCYVECIKLYTPTQTYTYIHARTHTHTHIHLDRLVTHFVTTPLKLGVIIKTNEFKSNESGFQSINISSKFITITMSSS